MVPVYINVKYMYMKLKSLHDHCFCFVKNDIWRFSGKKTTKKWVRWTRAEEMALHSAFPKILWNPDAHLPGQIEIKKMVEKYPVLKSRGYKTIYYKIISIRNEMTDKMLK